MEWKKENYSKRLIVKTKRDFGLLEDDEDPYNTVRQFSIAGNEVSYESMWETLQKDSQAMKKFNFERKERYLRVAKNISVRGA